MELFPLLFLQFFNFLVHYISSLSRAQQFINKWELQCMLLASFSLQVFLLFSSGFRKRYSSRVLSVLLWLAYLSADPVAVYILGRLSLRASAADLHNQQKLVLFWAPFLLLHLGGQETMTAFSMEDNTLWKRHLLSVATQMVTVIYVVSKQLQGDSQLVAPMVLVFIFGIAKYAERIWALRRAGSVAPGTSSSTANLVSRASSNAIWDTQGYYSQLCYLIEKKQQRNFKLILAVAAEGFRLSLGFFMDMTPSISLLPEDINEIKRSVEVFKLSEDFVHMSYKLAEINLSLIYDYLYTKFGTRHFHIVPFCIVFHLIINLALISTALALFVRAMAGQKAHDAADIIISYILLVGAIVLEICSIFMSFISSCWAYKTIITLPLTCPLCKKFPGVIAALLSMVRHLHEHNRGEWSRKLAQYNMIEGCIQEKQAGAGLLRRAMRCIGIDDSKAIKHIGVSPEVKKLVLDKLLEIASTSLVLEWDLGVGKFRGQWAQWVVAAKQDHLRRAAEQVLLVSNIQGLEFVSSALLWHMVTDICLLVDEDEDSGAELRGPTRVLSEYIMYLIAECGTMAGSEGHFVLRKGRREVTRWLREKSESGGDRKKLIEEIRNEENSFFANDYYPLLDRARRVSSDLLVIEESGDRWELIAAVWLEMLCHISYNCGAGFHAKQLTAGGEFVTHVKMLLFMLGVPFLRDVKEPLFYRAGNLYS
uniref:DUF4220 domain-containing protein n=1 Tax=Oryza brachyantha TaxID=4533 RepID=J3MKG4_ORYBR